MKNIFFIAILLLVSNTFAAVNDNLVKRGGTYYEKFSNIPYSGLIEESCTGKNSGTSQRGELVLGIKVGLWVIKSCDYNVDLLSETTYIDGVRSKVVEYYTDRNNRIREEKAYDINDLLTGNYRSYWNSYGRKAKELGSYIKGKKDGLWKKYSENGRLLEQGIFQEDSKEGEWEYFFSTYGKNLRLIENYKNNELDGQQTKYYENGVLEESRMIEDGSLVSLQTYNKNGGKINDLFFIDDSKNGQELIFFKNGNLKSKGTWKDGSKIGLWENYNNSGQLENETDYDSNIKVYFYYYSSGSLKEKQSFKEAKPINNWYLFNINGTIKEESFYKDDVVLNKKYLYAKNSKIPYARIDADNILEYLDADRKVLSRGKFINGKAEDIWIFFTNNSIDKKVNYRDGLIDGPYESFFSNGNLYEKGQIKNGKREGLWQAFDEQNGYIEHERYFINGKKEGIEKHYNIYGEMITSSMFKNGRQDGESKVFYHKDLIANDDDAKLLFNIQLYREQGKWDDQVMIFSQVLNKLNDDNKVTKEMKTPDTPQQLDEIDTSADTVNIDAGIGGFNAGEGEYLPIVKVAPIYPNRALSRGIEGWCIIEYTVTRNGTTSGAKVVECTSSLFANASVKATAKFKYKPRVINGTPIDVPGVQHKITFELEK